MAAVRSLQTSLQTSGTTIAAVRSLQTSGTTMAVEVDVRVWRRFQRLQSLAPAERKTVLKLLDSLLARYGAPDDNEAST